MRWLLNLFRRRKQGPAPADTFAAPLEGQGGVLTSYATALENSLAVLIEQTNAEEHEHVLNTVGVALGFHARVSEALGNATALMYGATVEAKEALGQEPLEDNPIVQLFRMRAAAARR